MPYRCVAIAVYVLLTGGLLRDAFGQERIAMANPASVYCVQSGYRLEIRTGTDGGQYGVCLFPDGAECEEWAFFRNECGDRCQKMPDKQSETIRSEQR
jgi:putative hemolysin